MGSLRARVIRMALAPAADEGFELIVDRSRHDDPKADQLIAVSAVPVLDALALEAQRLPARRALRHSDVDAAGDRRRLDLAAEHRLVERNRKLAQDIVAFA